MVVVDCTGKRKVFPKPMTRKGNKMSSPLNRIWQDSRLPQPVPSIPYRDRTQERRDREEREAEEKWPTPNTFPTFLFTLPQKDHATTCGIESIICEHLGCGLTHFPATGRWFTSAGIPRENVEVWIVSTTREEDLKRLVKDISLDLGEVEVFFLTLGEHTIL